MAPMKRPAKRRPEFSKTVSIEEAARRTQLPRKEIRRLMGAGRLGFIQIRGRFRVWMRDLERLVPG